MVEPTIVEWKARALRAEEWVRKAAQRAVGTVDAATLCALDGEEARDRMRAQEAEAERLTVERDAAIAAERERQRVDSWYNARLESAQRSDADLREFLSGDQQRHREDIPPGWPPGASPDLPLDYDALPSGDDASDTSVGKLLASLGVDQPGLTKPAHS
ncbi:MAG: DUF4670 domain-containing protein [Xanthobacteraceae bacterium]|nr:DUF4670 domain-containing protein [Xanthobacteraceae bacterium]